MPAKPACSLPSGGLYLEVSPTGSKWWRLKYRFDGKEKRLALGVYPDVGLKDARERREAARKLLANGVDLCGALSRVKKSQFAAKTDPEAVEGILRALDGYQGTSPVRCAMRLAPLLFVRPGELRTAQWADIDLEERQWCYVVTKTKTPHIVPPSRQAIEIPNELRPRTESIATASIMGMFYPTAAIASPGCATQQQVSAKTTIMTSSTASRRQVHPP